MIFSKSEWRSDSKMHLGSMVAVSLDALHGLGLVHLHVHVEAPGPAAAVWAQFGWRPIVEMNATDQT